MRDHRAAIPVAQVPVVHPAVPLPLVALHLRDLLHLHRDLLVQNHRDPIANVAVKIYQRVVVQVTVVVQRVKYRKGAKPVIHAGFVLSR
jgi:hypothetical protein